VLRRHDLVRMFTVIPFLAENVAHPKLSYVKSPSHPWPAKSREAARDHFGVAGDAAVILAFGSIDWRKDIATLLCAASLVPLEVPIKVLIAGTQVRGDVAGAFTSDAARRLAAEGRLVVIDRDIREATDPNPCVAADMVWVRYHRSFRHQSAVMVKAGQAHRPIVARPTGILGWYVERCGVGLAVESDDPQAVADAIVRLASDPVLRATLGEAGYRTFSGHTDKEFARPICEAICGTPRGV
jgi:glycosyltransferase involved in cell wall biosynthesis